MPTNRNKPQSIILKGVSRYVFLFMNVLALYIFLKGHNAPGGGFIAGILSAVSLIFLYMARGADEIDRMIRIDPATIAVVGLIVAYGSSFAPVLAGKPFLFHKMLHLHLPLLGDIHIGTPMLFDLGVYLVVVGMAVKGIFSFSYAVEHRAKHLIDEEKGYGSKKYHPVDIPLPETKEENNECT